MLEILFWVAVGAFVGWNLPQPWYAKKLQDVVVGWWKNLTGSDSTG